MIGHLKIRKYLSTVVLYSISTKPKVCFSLGGRSFLTKITLEVLRKIEKTKFLLCLNINSSVFWEMFSQKVTTFVLSLPRVRIQIF